MAEESKYTQEQIESRLREAITVYQDQSKPEEVRNRAKMIGMGLQDALRNKDYKKPSASQQMFNVFEKVQKHHDKRVKAVTESIEKHAEGDITEKEVHLRTVGNAAGLALDAVGEGVQAVTPEPVKEKIQEYATYLVDTDFAQALIKEWNNLEPRTRDNWSSILNVNSLLIPKVKTGAGYVTEKATGAVANKGIKASELLRRKRISQLFMEPKADTSAGKEAFFKNQFELTKYHKDMVDELADVEGLTPMRTFKANGEILFKELDKSATQLRNRLRTMPRKIPESDINQTLKDNLQKLYDEDHFLQTDQSIRNAFDLNMQRMAEIIDEHPRTPEGLLQARQKFDTLLKSKVWDKKFSTEKRAAIDESSRLMRRTVNDLIAKYAPETDVKAMLNRQHQLYKGIDSLAYQFAVKHSGPEKAIQFLKQHPYIAYGLVTGTGVTGATMTGLLPAAAGAAAVGGAGLTAYRYSPELVKAISKMVKGSGKAVKDFPVGAGRAGMFYGQDETIQ